LFLLFLQHQQITNSSLKNSKTRHMKKSILLKTILVLTISIFINNTISAQTVELTAAYGYQFGSKSEYGWNEYVKFDEGDQYSFTIGVDMFQGVMTEVTYTHQSTSIIQKDNELGTEKLMDLNADWIMVGASKYLTKDKLRPFIGGGLGMAIFNPNNEIPRVGRVDTKFYLAFSAKAGVNYMFTEQLGINVQGNLMIPIQWGGVYIGTGGAGLSGSSNILVGGFSGGLVYRLK
jgi:outer membrane protein W